MWTELFNAYTLREKRKCSAVLKARSARCGPSERTILADYEARKVESGFDLGGDSSKCKSAKVLLSGNMPFSCTFRNSSPNCSDGGTSDAQVAICARAEWAFDRDIDADANDVQAAINAAAARPRGPLRQRGGPCIVASTATNSLLQKWLKTVDQTPQKESGYECKRRNDTARSHGDPR